MRTLTIEQLPEEIVDLATTPEGMERARAAVLAAFSEDAQLQESKLQATRERFRAMARKQAAHTEALFAEWAIEDATDDPEELRRRDEEAMELRQAMNETRRLNGERLHFPELDDAA